MATFRDATGREWPLTITYGASRALKGDAGCDLSDVANDGEKLARVLFGDPDALVRVLWVLVRDRAAAAGVSEGQFFDALDPAAMDAASDALMEAITDFFHRRRAGAVKSHLPAMRQRIDATHAAAVTAAVRDLTSPSTSPGTSAGSPGSSGSTPPG